MILSAVDNSSYDCNHEFDLGKINRGFSSLFMCIAHYGLYSQFKGEEIRVSLPPSLTPFLQELELFMCYYYDLIKGF